MDKNSSFGYVVAWHYVGHKPIPEPMMVPFKYAYMYHQPQCVECLNLFFYFHCFLHFFQNFKNLARLAVIFEHQSKGMWLFNYTPYFCMVI